MLGLFYWIIFLIAKKGSQKTIYDNPKHIKINKTMPKMKNKSVKKYNKKQFEKDMSVKTRLPWQH